MDEGTARDAVSMTGPASVPAGPPSPTCTAAGDPWLPSTDEPNRGEVTLMTNSKKAAGNGQFLDDASRFDATEALRVWKLLVAELAPVGEVEQTLVAQIAGIVLFLQRLEAVAAAVRRRLLDALRELRRLQAARAGTPVPPASS